MSGRDWIGVGLFFLYFIIGAGVIAVISSLIKIPQEFRRKAYHLMACGSILVLLWHFDNWYGALTAIGLFLVAVYAVVPAAMRLFSFKHITVQRGGSIKELLYQASVFLLTLGLLIAVIWGLIGEEHKLHILIGVTALSLGDAAAALIGRHFGKNKLRFKLFDPNKTVEGSLGMIGFAFIGIFTLLLVYTDLSIGTAFFSALLLAIVSAIVEAAAVHGSDTVLIPVIVSFASLGLLFLVS
jgi:phytol kinase